VALIAGASQLNASPVAVPEKQFASRRMLLFFDRCPALTSLYLPQAALGSLSLSRLLWVLSCSAARKCPAGGSHVANSKAGGPDPPLYKFAGENPISLLLTAGQSRRTVPTVVYGKNVKRYFLS